MTNIIHLNKLCWVEDGNETDDIQFFINADTIVSISPHDTNNYLGYTQLTFLNGEDITVFESVYQVLDKIRGKIARAELVDVGKFDGLHCYHCGELMGFTEKPLMPCDSNSQLCLDCADATTIQ